MPSKMAWLPEKADRFIRLASIHSHAFRFPPFGTDFMTRRGWWPSVGWGSVFTCFFAGDFRHRKPQRERHESQCPPERDFDPSLERIGNGKSQSKAQPTEKHRKTGQPIDVRVMAVGHQCHAVDLFSGVDTKPCHQPVAGKSDQCRTGHCPQVQHSGRLIKNGGSTRSPRPLPLK